MFQFRWFPTYDYFIHRMLIEYSSIGFPHSEICGSKLICSSPQLIAACHVLHRLLMPRHSPCALISLTSSKLIGSQFELCKLIQKFFSFTEIVVFHILILLLYTLFCCFACFRIHCSVFKVHLALSFDLALSFFSKAHRVPQFLSCITRSTLDRSLFCFWWAQVDSNHRPLDYQSNALAS